MPGAAIDAHPEAHHRHGVSMGQVRDEDRLADLGYNQDLKRGWSMIQSFGISFSIISVITGVTTLFSYGLTTGGPATMAYSWVVSFFTMFVALSMAEIVSAIPTSGGPYHWAALIASPKYSAFAAWTTGYANLLGQVAVTTGISFGNAGLISTLGAIHGYEPSAKRTIGIYAGLLVSHGIVNSCGVSALGLLNYASVACHSLGVTGLMIALLAKAPTHRTGAEVFQLFYDGTGGWSERASPAYICVISILTAQYTITGFDASAHMSEETTNAAWSAPMGVIMSVGASTVFGFFVLVSMLFCIQDFDGTVSSEAGQPVLQIFWDCFGKTGATVAFAFIIVCVYFCGLFSITSNSRMMYAFSRDRALPGWFDHVDARFSSPIRTIWLAVVLAFILALPSLGSAVAFSAATSIATIGLYISYAIPILLLLIESKNFVRGPFHLGKFSRPIGTVAVLWVVFITIATCLPEVNPVDSQTLNYTPVAIGIVAIYALGSWFLWARKWFKGPRSEALAELEQEPGHPNTHLHKTVTEDKKGQSESGTMIRPASS